MMFQWDLKVVLVPFFQDVIILSITSCHKGLGETFTLHLQEWLS